MYHITIDKKMTSSTDYHTVKKLRNLYVSNQDVIIKKKFYSIKIK